MNTPLATSLYQSLMFLHVLAAMIWLGGVVAVTVLAAGVLRTGRHEDVARFIGSLCVLGPLTLGPASLAVLGLGIGLILDSNAWHFSQGWVVLALALIAAAFLVGAGGAGVAGRAAIGARRAAAASDEGKAIRQLRRWSWGMRLILLFLVVATWDMVAKPTL